MAQNNSWKKYGGINNYDNLSSINVNSLVANNISLKNPYQGIFTICGELIVSNNTYLEQDLYITGKFECNNLGNFLNDLDVSGNVDISSNLYVKGNTYLYNPLYLVGSKGQNLDLNTGIGTTFFIGDVSGVGMNKYNPEATLDISGVTSSVLNLYTTTSDNRNILARNNANYGVVLSTDLSHSYIDFYSSDYAINSTMDKGIGGGGGTIRYDPSGVLVLDVSNNLRMLSRMSISNRNDLLSNHINNETLVVYDNSTNVFRPDIYNNPRLYNGTALSLISSDNSANTFLRITTPGSKGWAFGAGMYPYDISRNMGTLGWIDTSGIYIPLEYFVSGNSLVKNRATMGINTFTPETERYIMDINGPIHLHHNEIHLIQNVLFQVNAISYWLTNTNYGVAVGTSIDISANSQINYQFNVYRYKALYTINGGNTWNFSDISSNIVLTNFTVFYYNPEYILIAGNNNVIYRSSNAGISWNNPQFNNPLSIPSIYINQIYSSTTQPYPLRTYFSYPYYNSQTKTYAIYYYDNNYDGSQNRIDVSNNLDNSYNIYSIHGYFNDTKTVGRLFVAGESVAVYNAITMNRLNVFTNDISYNKIYTYDGSFAVAISKKSVIYTIDGGVHWNYPVSFPTLSSDLNDVCVWDLSNAIAVGNNGLIIYTINGAKEWKILHLSDINAMGNGSNIINTSKNLTAVKMTDTNTFSIACVSQKYVSSVYNQNGNLTSLGTPGITDMFYLHLPDLFNRHLYPSIFDVSGNMTITGDIHINDYGKLQSNNQDFYILDKTVETVYFARDASNIHIGNIIVGGETVIQHRLTVFDDCSFNSRLFVGHDVSLNSNLFVNRDVSFNSRLFVGQDVSLNANLFVNRDVSFNSRLFVGRDVSLNANVFVNRDVSFNSRLFVGQDVSLNANLFVNRDVSFNSRLFVGQDVSFNANLFVNRDVSFNSRLFVGQDVSLNANLFVNRDVSFNSRLFVGNDVSLNANLFVNRDVSFNSRLFVGNDVSMNNNVYGRYINSEYFGSLTGNLRIGDNLLTNPNSTRPVIYIGTATVITDIIIGGGTSNILFQGNLYSSTITSVGKQLILNSSEPPPGDTVFENSSFGGVIVNDYNFNNSDSTRELGASPGSASILVSSDCNNWDFKISKSANIIGLDVPNLTYSYQEPNQDYVNNSRISSITNNYIEDGGGLLILQRNPIPSSQTMNRYSIQVAPIDINNIVLRDSRYTDNNANNNQVITTNFGIIGNLAVNRSSTTSGQPFSLDISGITNISKFLFVVDDVSLNANFFVNRDVSFNSRLFVGQDVSLNANLFVNRDVSFNSRLFVGQDVSLNANVFVNRDVSFNSRLFVGQDVSLNANLFVNRDVSFNSRLFVGQDVSLNANLFVNRDVSFNSRLFVGQDVSLNANVFVNRDVSFNSRLFVGQDVSFNANLFVNRDVSFNSRLFVGNDVSLNANLFVNRDASFNSRLFVGQDVSLNANLFVNRDVSFNSRLFVGRDVSLNANLFVNRDVSFNSRLFVGQDVSFNANLFVNRDVSFNSRLFVGRDVSLNANLFVNRDVSFNSRLFVGNDVSFNSNLFVKKDVSFNSNLSVGNNIQFGNQIIYDASINPYNKIFSNYFPISLLNTNSENLTTDLLASTTASFSVTSGLYTYVVFKTVGSGNITFKNNYLADYLIIGGGGAGGTSSNSNGAGGGGGAGGIINGVNYTITANTTYNVTVGAGGNPLINGGTTSFGGSSSAFGIDVSGGGNGGGLNNGNNNNNGSGGGGGGYDNSATGGQIQNITNANKGGGGYFVNTGFALGGGGGGSGSAGSDASLPVSAGAGGNGTTIFSEWISAISSNMNQDWINATNGLYIAAGGGGGAYYSGNLANGGLGGGGAGGKFSSASAISGTTNTGSGGGGGSSSNLLGSAGSGGSGLVIIRYKTPTPYAGSGVSLCNKQSSGNIVGGYAVSSSLTNNYLNFGLITNSIIQNPMLQMNYNNGYSSLIVNDDVSFNSRLFIRQDVSMNANVFVNRDVSFNSRLFVGQDVSLNANMFVNRDVSFNSRLFVGQDVSFNANLFVNRDVSFNSRLFVGQDVSLNANLFVNRDVSFNSRLFVGQDVSFNANLFVNRDVSFNSRLFVGQDVSLNANLFVNRDVSFNSRLFVGQDVSFNANLFVNRDVSFNSRLFVGRDVSLNANLFVNRDVSFNSRLFVGRDVSFNANLFVNRDVSFNSRLFVGQDVSFNANLFVNRDVSFNSRLFVGRDVSFNANLFVNRDVSFNSQLFVGNNLFVNGIGRITQLGINTAPTTTLDVNGDAVFRATLQIQKVTGANDAIASTSSTTGALKVTGGAGITGNLNVGGSINSYGYISLSATRNTLIVNGNSDLANHFNIFKAPKASATDMINCTTVIESVVGDSGGKDILINPVWGGSVGIGLHVTGGNILTSNIYMSPSYKLDVGGNINASTGLFVNGTNINTIYAPISSPDFTGAIQVFVTPYRYHIGRTMPNAHNGMYICMNDASNCVIQGQYHGRHYNNLCLNPYADSNGGSVGIGTLTPDISYKLDVVGKCRVIGELHVGNTLATTPNATMTYRCNGAYTSLNLQKLNPGQQFTMCMNSDAQSPETFFKVTSAGNYGSNNANNLDTTIYGRLTVSANASGGAISGGSSTYSSSYGGTITAISVSATSDYRIKSNIVPVFQTVDKLNPIYFYNNTLRQNDIGLIAHELQEEFPFLVTGEKDGKDMQSVNYTGLIGVLIKEIQDLKKRVAQLEAKN